MQGGRHSGDLRDHKVYPNILPGDSATGLRGCLMRLGRKNHPTLRGFPDNFSNLKNGRQDQEKALCEDPRNVSPRDGLLQEHQTLRKQLFPGPPRVVGIPGPGRTLQAVHTRVCKGGTAIELANCQMILCLMVVDT